MNLNTNNKNLMSQDSGVSGVLNPWFLTGFTDAEACYRVSIIKNKNYKPGLSKDTSGGRLTTLPLSVRLYFQIGLHRKDEDILRLIQSELGVGGGEGLLRILRNRLSMKVYLPNNINK